MPSVAVVLTKELILHLPRTTCSSLPCGQDAHGPCTHSACGEELPLPAVPPREVQEVAFRGPCAAVEQQNTMGRGAAGGRTALTPVCGLAASCVLLWEFPKSLKHKKVVKTFLPFYVLPGFFPSSLFMGWHITRCSHHFFFPLYCVNA